MRKIATMALALGALMSTGCSMVRTRCFNNEMIQQLPLSYVITPSEESFLNIEGIHGHKSLSETYVRVSIKPEKLGHCTIEGIKYEYHVPAGTPKISPIFYKTKNGRIMGNVYHTVYPLREEEGLYVYVLNGFVEEGMIAVGKSVSWFRLTKGIK